MSSSDRFSGSSTRHFVSSIPSKSSSKVHLLLSNQSLLSAPINYLNSQTFKLRSSKYTNGTKKVYSILDNHGSLTKVSSFFQYTQGIYLLYNSHSTRFFVCSSFPFLYSNKCSSFICASINWLVPSGVISGFVWISHNFIVILQKSKKN